MTTVFTRNGTPRGVFFVTKMKDNAVYEVVAEHTAPKGLMDFREIRLKNCSVPLNTVVYEDEKTGEILELMSNKMDMGATTIVKVYKRRRQIETFFRSLKQHFKIKTFVGAFSNAVHIQIWTALTALLITKYLQFVSSPGWSFSALVFMLQHNLFRYTDIWAWLKNTFENKEEYPPFEQPYLPGFCF